LGSKETFEQSKELYANMLSRYKDEDAATAATTMLKIQQVQHMLNATAASLTGEQATNGKNQANELLNQEIIKQKMVFEQGLLHRQMLQQAGEDSAISFLSDKDKARHVSGRGLAPSPFDKQEFLKVSESLEPTLDDLHEIQQLTKDYNKLSSFTDFSKKRAIETQINMAIGKLRVPIVGPGVVTPQERDIIARVVGEPTKFLSYSPAERMALTTTIRAMERNLAAAASRYGVPKRVKNFQVTQKPVTEAGAAD
jgi:hypothetical protein